MSAIQVTDNSGATTEGLNITVSPPGFTIDPVDPEKSTPIDAKYTKKDPLIVTYTATDLEGNTAQCTFRVRAKGMYKCEVLRF